MPAIKKRHLMLLISVFLLALVPLSFARAAAPVDEDRLAWETQVVDEQPRGSDETADPHSAMDLDRFGQPHFVYHDPVAGSLKHAVLLEGEWAYEEIDDDGGELYPAVASFQDTHVTYYDSTNNALRYAHQGIDVWMQETIAIGGKYSSLAIDFINQPHISFGLGNEVWYAYVADGNWHIEVVDELPSPVINTSLALGSGETAHIVYNNEAGAIHYARRNGPHDWSTEPVTTGDMFRAPRALALDAMGQPHFVFATKELHSHKQLRLASRHDDFGVYWTDEEIAEVITRPDATPGFHYLSLALYTRAETRVHVMAAVAGEQPIHYYYWDGATWMDEPLNGMPGNTSVGLDSDGLPHLSYNNETQLLFMRPQLHPDSNRLFLPGLFG